MESEIKEEDKTFQVLIDELNRITFPEMNPPVKDKGKSHLRVKFSLQGKYDFDVVADVLVNSVEKDVLGKRVLIVDMYITNCIDIRVFGVSEWYLTKSQAYVLKKIVNEKMRIL